MVRAAATGVVDYSRADPENRHWRIQHKLLLKEIKRAEELRIAAATQQHWLSYISHGRLTEESFEDAKTLAVDAFETYKNLVFPWLSDPDKAQRGTAGSNSAAATIDKDTANLIAAYRARFQNKTPPPS